MQLACKTNSFIDDTSSLHFLQILLHLPGNTCKDSVLGLLSVHLMASSQSTYRSHSLSCRCCKLLLGGSTIFFSQTGNIIWSEANLLQIYWPLEVECHRLCTVTSSDFYLKNSYSLQIIPHWTDTQWRWFCCQICNWLWTSRDQPTYLIPHTTHITVQHFWQT